MMLTDLHPHRHVYTSLCSHRIILDETLVKPSQFRFPRSRRRRIREKWADQSRNYKMIPLGQFFIVGNKTLVAHPDDWARIRRELESIHHQHFGSVSIPLSGESIASLTIDELNFRSPAQGVSANR